MGETTVTTLEGRQQAGPTPVADEVEVRAGQVFLRRLRTPRRPRLWFEILLIAVSVPLVFRMMGRDYEASVMGGGFVGFMLGTTANAMAVMRTLVERYGPAPRAFLVAPMVGAFFIDFANSALVTALVNVLR